MTRDQKVVAVGAGCGVAAMVLAMWLLSTGVLPAPAGVDTAGDRLGYALRWAAFAALPLAASLAPAHVQLIAAAAIVFAAARLAFWIGYRIDPLYRAFGFAATFYLNLGLLLAALWLGFA